ncbi:MAG: MaoC family dehydratase [Pseudomonadales bacterium]
MSAEPWNFEGDIRQLGNPSASKKRSIHDDQTARTLGFKGAFVPGSVVGTLAIPAILERYDEDWFKGGWYNFKFVSPVYTNDYVHVVAADTGAGEIEIRVVTHDQRLCLTGRAGLGLKQPMQVSGGDDDVFPDAIIGQTFEDKTITVERAQAQDMLDAARDTSPLWERLVPPEHWMGVALRMMDWKLIPLTDIQPPGMWAEHALIVKRPLGYGTWHLSEYLAAKGRSGRANFVDCAFSIRDESGEEVAVGRQKNKFIRSVV